MNVEHFYVHQAAFLKCSEKVLWLSKLERGYAKDGSIHELSRIVGRKLRSKSWDSKAAWERAKKEYLQWKGGMFSAVVYATVDYPQQLENIYDPPFLLYGKGNWEQVKKKPVAIVGTRVPEGQAANFAWKLGFELAKKKIPVVSGLALGIDRFAHEGNHRGGVGSIAVLGCGVDWIYPASNKPLALELLKQGGLILSEYPPETQPANFRFPERNRIVSGLCPLTIVVQAPEKSGALITADFALGQNREVAVCKVGLNGERGRGTWKLADEGAFVIERKEDLWEKLNNP